jgi:putative ABC transport system permease protein
MHRVAIRSLLFHRDKFAAALAGVTFAAMMVFVQGGVYIGFLEAAAGLVTRVGGDLWIAPRGTSAVDLSETMSPQVGLWVRSQPCVRRARPIFIGFVQYRFHTPEGPKLNGALVVAGEAADAGRQLPWATAQGLPADLRAPLRLTVDQSDLPRLGLSPRPIGEAIELGGVTARVAAVTRGIRSFTTAPVMFTKLEELQFILGLPKDAARFWVVDLVNPACAAEVARRIEARGDLQAVPTAEFRSRSEAQWIGNSGVGALLGFSAFLGFLVGAVIVAQTLFHITMDHVKELGTLKALGARDTEILAFVGWQAAFLAACGSLVGLVLAKAIAYTSHALVIAITLPVVLVGTGVIGLMCAIACLASARKVIAIEPAEVFR